MELQWKYAEACRLSNQYPQAAESYEKVWRKDLGRSHPEALRWLGEMQLCSGAKVTEGRKAKDLHSRLKEDIERGRQMYHDRISPGLRNNTNYFHDELVRLLAGGDASALGSM